jgi:hypothetical protein
MKSTWDGVGDGKNTIIPKLRSAAPTVSAVIVRNTNLNLWSKMISFGREGGGASGLAWISTEANHPNVEMESRSRISKAAFSVKVQSTISFAVALSRRRTLSARNTML